jgi:hypothetical protein
LPDIAWVVVACASTMISAPNSGRDQVTARCGTPVSAGALAVAAAALTWWYGRTDARAARGRVVEDQAPGKPVS